MEDGYYGGSFEETLCFYVLEPFMLLESIVII